MSWPERDEQAVEILKEWYKKQPHLPQGIQDDYFVTFAYGSKTIEIAKQKIDAFFTMRNDIIWSRNFDSSMDTFIKESGGDYFYLPDTTPEGWRVLVASFYRVDMGKLDPMVELFRRMLLVELGLVVFPRDTSVCMIYDLFNCPASYLARLDLPAEVSIVNFAVRALPRRVKKIIVLNSSPTLEKTTNLIKMFMPKKMVERLVVMQGTAGLKDHLPERIMPKEYGGEAGTIQELGDAWRKKTLDSEDWLRKNLKLCSDETKRPKDLLNKCLDSGTQGSFRSLTID